MASHEVVVATIASTRTRTGLQVHAQSDVDDYPHDFAGRLFVAQPEAAGGAALRRGRTR